MSHHRKHSRRAINKDQFFLLTSYKYEHDNIEGAREHSHLQISISSSFTFTLQLSFSTSVFTLGASSVTAALLKIDNSTGMQKQQLRVFLSHMVSLS